MSAFDVKFFLDWFDRLNPAFLRNSKTLDFQYLLPQYKDLVVKEYSIEHQNCSSLMKRKLRPPRCSESRPRAEKKPRNLTDSS